MSTTKGMQLVQTLTAELNISIGTAARNVAAHRFNQQLEALEPGGLLGNAVVLALIKNATPEAVNKTPADINAVRQSFPDLFEPDTGQSVITNADLIGHNADNPFDAGTSSYTFELTATDALTTTITNFEDDDKFVFINASEHDFVASNPIQFDSHAEITVKQVEVELVGLVADFFWDVPTFRQVFGEDSLVFESGPASSLALRIFSGHVSDPVFFEIQNWSAGAMQGNVRLEQDGFQLERMFGNNGHVEIANHGFDPGAVLVTVEVWSGDEILLDESKTIGLYNANQTYQFTWADTDIEPFNMIGQVVVKHSGEAGYAMGTGFLISPRHVMTNAHVVSLQEDQVDLDNLVTLDFFLGRNGQRLLEEADNNGYSGSSVFLQKSEWDDMWPDTDMAIITLSNPVQGLEDQQHFDWFWNMRGTNTDLTGQTVYASGYPSDGILQGSGTYFQWAVEGVVTGYWQGYDDFGAESGGLKFSASFESSGGASGSPIIRIAEDGSYQFVGAYTGSWGNTPVAANLDRAAYDWALTVVQSDGYLMNMAFLDGPWDFNDFPGKTLNAAHTAVAYADYDQVVVQPAGVSWEYTDLGLVA